MRKFSSFLILTLSCLIFFLAVSDSIAQKKQKKRNRAEAKSQQLKNGYIGLESVILERESLNICPFFPYKDGMYCDGDKSSISVSATAKEVEENGLIYRYFVTGGTIIGNGANVIWDLKGAKMGNYLITVALVKDAAVKGKTITKSFSYGECDTCDPPCSCPILSVIGSKAIAKAGDGLIFTAELKGKGNERY